MACAKAHIGCKEDATSAANTATTYAQSKPHSDAGLIAINGNDAANLVYVNPHLMADVTDAYSHYEQGHWVCASLGFSNHEECNHGGRQLTVSVDYKRVCDLVEGNFYCRKGDSGSPVYHYNGHHSIQAVGIVTTLRLLSRKDYGPCYYSQVRYVESDLKASSGLGTYVKTTR